MWDRIRSKYLIVLLLMPLLYPVSFAPALYYLLHYAKPTNESFEAFATVYRKPLDVLPISTTTGLIHAFGYPRMEAKMFAQRLNASGFRFY